MIAARPRPAVVAGNVYDQYRTRTPVARRLMAGFERSMFDLLATTRPVEAVLEVGCGEGEVTAQLARLLRNLASNNVLTELQTVGPTSDILNCADFNLNYIKYFYLASSFEF